jgi:hypothetical protein
VKPVVSLLLVSVLIGAVAALAATAICSLTSATLTPFGGALLGAGFGLTAGNLTAPRAPGSRGVLSALARGLVAGSTAALVILLLQQW